ncbi:hypothetical protein R1sor_023757 [Riccia sorocarpa]|uniref:Uncharacterized protein n=1 Tax=Riccia sorocarpa TaxID=122646 RepID=A0ABD3GSK8_9MARC
MSRLESGDEGIYSGEGDGNEDYGLMTNRGRGRPPKRKPSAYYDDPENIEEDWEDDAVPGNDDEDDMEILKMEQSEDFCRACGTGGKLLCCDTCPAVYHLGCLDPPLKIAPMGKWSCHICVDPLENLEKIVDSQMKALRASGRNVPEDCSGPSSRLVRHYLVKWKGKSYLHCSWVKQEELEKAMKTFPGIRMKLNHFQRQLEAAKKMSTSDEDRISIRPEWTTVDRILDSRQNGDVKEYFVKWKDLGYDALTWEAEDDIAPFQSEISKYSALMQKGAAKALMRRKIAAGLEVKETKRRRKEFKPYKKTPKFLSGGALHRYQLEGLNFLRFASQQEKHCMLADEVGLGKTVQTIAFLASLAEESLPFQLPHLVVVPTPTIQNWEREFSFWAPHLNVVLYGGSSEARTFTRDYEFYFPNRLKGIKDKTKKKQISELRQSKQDRIKFDVLLTSHEMVNLDQSILRAIKWECLIVDEGHRLKNKDLKLIQTYEAFAAHQRVLLTGSPLPSSTDELLVLMNFLGANKFVTLGEFQEEFRDLHHEEQVLKLQKLLQPHMLRRVKREVLRELPTKKELILPVELTSLQKEYYRKILIRNYQVLSRPGGPQIALNIVMMELRKLCAHPFMLDGAEPFARNEQEANRLMLEASEKFILLERMMAKLRIQGHRVLIYSQFTRMLDILEEWLLYKKWGYERIDGKIGGADRRIRIDRYNAPNTTKFCFLLSAQAGVGVNLCSADTVILYDSDWNPHADLQAIARADVMIYRLVTKGTIEERIMQMAKRRMVLDNVGCVKPPFFNHEELDDMLKYGVKEIFADGNQMVRSFPVYYEDTGIERLLDRSQLDGTGDRLDEDTANDLARAYKNPDHDYIYDEGGEDKGRGYGNDGQIPRSDASERSYFWHSLLKDKAERQHLLEESDDHKSKKSRKQSQYSGLHFEEDDLAGMADVSSDEDDNDYPSQNDQESVYVRDVQDSRKLQPSKKKAREEPQEERLEPPPLMDGEGRCLKVLGFTQKQRAIFVQVLMRYGLGDFTWSEFAPRLKQKTREEIKNYGTLFLSHIAEDISDSPTFTDGVPKEGLRIQDVLVRLAVLHLIGDKVRLLQDNPKTPLLSIGARNHRYYSLRNTKVWKEEHDRKLLQAILKLGYGRWQAIVDDPDLDLQPVIRNEILLRENAGEGRPVDGEGGMGSTQHAESQLDGGSEDKGSDDEMPIGSLLPGANRETSETYIQKKMVDFVKRRVLVLEKVLNAEYLKETADPVILEESVPVMVETRSEVPGSFPLDSLGGRGQIVKNSQAFRYPIPLASEDIQAAVVDDDPNRVKVAQIYGQMCELILENEGDADQAYVGNKSAGLRLRKSLRQLDTLCLEMRKALFGQPLQSRKPRTKPEGTVGHEMVAHSDEGSDDPGVDSENENDTKIAENIKEMSSSSGAEGQSTAEEPSPEEQHQGGRGFVYSTENEEKPTKRFEIVSLPGATASVKLEQSSAVGLDCSSSKRVKGAKVYVSPPDRHNESL